MLPFLFPNPQKSQPVKSNRSEWWHRAHYTSAHHPSSLPFAYKNDVYNYTWGHENPELSSPCQCQGKTRQQLRMHDTPGAAAQYFLFPSPVLSCRYAAALSDFYFRWLKLMTVERQRERASALRLLQTAALRVRTPCVPRRPPSYRVSPCQASAQADAPVDAAVRKFH